MPRKNHSKITVHGSTDGNGSFANIWPNPSHVSRFQTWHHRLWPQMPKYHQKVTVIGPKDGNCKQSLAQPMVIPNFRQTFQTPHEKKVDKNTFARKSELTKELLPTFDPHTPTLTRSTSWKEENTKGWVLDPKPWGSKVHLCLNQEAAFLFLGARCSSRYLRWWGTWSSDEQALQVPHHLREDFYLAAENIFYR